MCSDCGDSRKVHIQMRFSFLSVLSPSEMCELLHRQCSEYRGIKLHSLSATEFTMRADAIKNKEHKQRQ